MEGGRLREVFLMVNTFAFRGKNGHRWKAAQAL